MFDFFNYFLIIFNKKSNIFIHFKINNYHCCFKYVLYNTHCLKFVKKDIKEIKFARNETTKNERKSTIETLFSKI